MHLCILIRDEGWEYARKLKLLTFMFLFTVVGNFAMLGV